MMLHSDSSGTGSALRAAVIPGPRRESQALVADDLVRARGVHHDFRYDVAVVGMGYVGLPTALSFTTAGLSVVGVDLNPARLHDIKVGTVDLVPTDIARLEIALAEQSLVLSSAVDVIGDAATIIICVPTPVDRHLVPDLRALRGACATVVAHATDGQLVILTSTSYVGTTRDLLIRPLTQRGFAVGKDLHVAFSPERIDPANQHYPQEVVPRVVGGVTDDCTKRAATALGAYAQQVHVVSSPEAAELTKLLENTFRAVNIAMINEIADLSGTLGIEITEVIDAASTKPYGFMPFTPGPGVGGHCIPCDPYYLLWQLRKSRVALPVVEQAMTSIALRPQQVVRRVRELLSDSGRAIRGAHVLVVGCAYKPGVSDYRESPALEVLEALEHLGARVSFYDPRVPELRHHDGRSRRGVDDPGSAGADLIVLHTLHPDTDYGWVVEHPLVLDATFRFTQAQHRALL
jgi:nucleotide sugar dehydrogenase